MSAGLESLLDADRRADCARNDTALSQWHRSMAASIAAAHPLTYCTPIRARGNHLSAAQDEPELECSDEGL